MAELPDIFIDISNGRVTWHFSRYKSLTYIYNWFTNYGVFVYTIYRIYRTLFISINLSPANLSFFYRTIKPAKRNWALDFTNDLRMDKKTSHGLPLVITSNHNLGRAEDFV